MQHGLWLPRVPGPSDARLNKQADSSDYSSEPESDSDNEGSEDYKKGACFADSVVICSVPRLALFWYSILQRRTPKTAPPCLICTAGTAG